MNKIQDKIWRTIHGHPVLIKNKRKPWEAMYKKDGITKKTIPIYKTIYSKEEPEYEKGYSKNKNEIKSAKFIQGMTGQRVKLLKTVRGRAYNPDAMVNGKYADFKNPEPTSKNGIDSLTRHGLKQINIEGKEKAGFVFHDADSLQRNKREINKQVTRRMLRSKDMAGDVIVKKKKSLIIYNKKK